MIAFQPTRGPQRGSTLLRILLSLLCLPLMLPQSASATLLELSGIWLVSRRANEAVATPESRSSSIDNPVHLHVVIEGRAPGRLPIYFTEAPSIDLGWGVVPAHQVRPWDPRVDGAIDITWFRLEPLDRSYDNLKPSFHLEAIEYAQTPIADQARQWSYVADVRPTLMPNAGSSSPRGLGIARFKVQIDHQGLILQTPGAAGLVEGGIGPEVTWVAYRGPDANPLVSWAQARFNTPYVTGASRRGGGEESHQAALGTGIDSIELLAAAHRLAGHLEVGFIGPFLLDAGHEARATLQIARVRPENDDYIDQAGELIKVGPEGIMPGDLLRSGEQAGIFARDRVPLGYLDPNDLVVTALFREPRIEVLSDSLHGPLTLLRWNEVREVQLDLKLLGFYTGEVDGRSSKELLGAVDSARLRSGLEPLPGETIEELLRSRAGYDRVLPPFAALGLLRSGYTALKLSPIDRGAFVQRVLARAQRVVGAGGEQAMTFQFPRPFFPEDGLKRRENEPFVPHATSFWELDKGLEKLCQTLPIGDADRDGNLDVSGQPVELVSPGPAMVLWTENDWKGRGATSLARRFGNQVWLYVPRAQVIVGFLHLEGVSVSAGSVLPAQAVLGTLGRTGSLQKGRRAQTALRVVTFATGEGQLTAIDPAGLWGRQWSVHPAPWFALRPDPPVSAQPEAAPEPRP